MCCTSCQPSCAAPRASLHVLHLVPAFMCCTSCQPSCASTSCQPSWASTSCQPSCAAHHASLHVYNILCQSSCVCTSFQALWRNPLCLPAPVYGTLNQRSCATHHAFICSTSCQPSCAAPRASLHVQHLVPAFMYSTSSQSSFRSINPTDYDDKICHDSMIIRKSRNPNKFWVYIQLNILNGIKIQLTQAKMIVGNYR